MTFFVLLISVFLFSSCSLNLAPISVVRQCNHQLQECNTKAHNKVCGNATCVTILLEGSSKAKKNLRDSIQTCEIEYNQCITNKF